MSGERLWAVTRANGSFEVEARQIADTAARARVLGQEGPKVQRSPAGPPFAACRAAAL